MTHMDVTNLVLAIAVLAAAVEILVETFASE